MINANTLKDTEKEESVVDLDLEDKPKKRTLACSSWDNCCRRMFCCSLFCLHTHPLNIIRGWVCCWDV